MAMRRRPPPPADGIPGPRPGRRGAARRRPVRRRSLSRIHALGRGSTRALVREHAATLARGGRTPRAPRGVGRAALPRAPDASAAQGAGVTDPCAIEPLLREILAVQRRFLAAIERPVVRAPLPRADGALLARLYPAIAGALGSAPFASRDWGTPRRGCAWRCGGCRCAGRWASCCPRAQGVSVDRLPRGAVGARVEGDAVEGVGVLSKGSPAGFDTRYQDDFQGIWVSDRRAAQRAERRAA